MLHAPIEAWASFIYLAVVSQFLAYVAWYNGLAKGGISRVSQIQYLQPFLMIFFAALFLNESITIFTMATAVIVVFSVVIDKNTVVANQLLASRLSLFQGGIDDEYPIFVNN